MISIKKNKSASAISYIRVGGMMREFAECDTVKETLSYLRAHPHFIALGNTSKILFAFDSCDIPFFRFAKKGVVFHSDSFFAYGGSSLSFVNRALAEKGYTGFEELSTIPGQIGGSLVNNASFLDRCISDLAIKILVYRNGEVVWIYPEDAKFGYRKSALNRENFLILGAEFSLKREERKKIEERIARAIEYRRKVQCETKGTLGSVFQNRDGIKVGKALDELGYRGYRFSFSVRLSPHHANFLSVLPHTNYHEIYDFITFLSAVLYNNFGTKFQWEIQVITNGGKRDGNGRQ